MNKEEILRLKQIEIELAYLRKSIEELKEQRVVEIHQHYYYDYEQILPIVNYYKQLNQEDGGEPFI